MSGNHIAIRGVAVLVSEQDHLLLEDIAIDPAHHRDGFGRQLLVFAEEEGAPDGSRPWRIEAICFPMEFAFAVRLPDSAELREFAGGCSA